MENRVYLDRIEETRQKMEEIGWAKLANRPLSMLEAREAMIRDIMESLKKYASKSETVLLRRWAVERDIDFLEKNVAILKQTIEDRLESRGFFDKLRNVNVKKVAKNIFKMPAMFKRDQSSSKNCYHMYNVIQSGGRHELNNDYTEVGPRFVQHAFDEVDSLDGNISQLSQLENGKTEIEKEEDYFSGSDDENDVTIEETSIRRITREQAESEIEEIYMIRYRPCDVITEEESQNSNDVKEPICNDPDEEDVRRQMDELLRDIDDFSEGYKSVSGFGLQDDKMFKKQVRLPVEENIYEEIKFWITSSFIIIKNCHCWII